MMPMWWEVRHEPNTGLCIFEGKRVVASLNSGFAFSVDEKDLARMTAAPELLELVAEMVDSRNQLFCLEDRSISAGRPTCDCQRCRWARTARLVVARARGAK